MTQLTPIKGFTNTPVSKSICIITTIVALSLSIFQWKHNFKLAIDPFLIEYSQYWRAVTYQLSVINESDYMLSIILWFHFKNLERFYGSRKYLSLITVFALYNSLVCIILMSVGQLGLNMVYFVVDTFIFKLSAFPAFNYRDTLFNEIAPGPLGIISSLYICFGTFIPVSYHFKILLSDPRSKDEPTEEPDSPDTQTKGTKELTFTNHFQIHVIYTLFLLNNGFASLLPCLVGLAIGKLHTEELLPGSKNWLLPSAIVKLFINPNKFFKSTAHSARVRFRHGYRAVNPNNSGGNTFEPPTTIDDTPPPVPPAGDNDDDQEEALDEIRSNESQHEIRAETPVRPFGSQLLDTFRT